MSGWIRKEIKKMTDKEKFLKVDWLNVLSIAAVAAICSMLTSAAGLPEIEEGSDKE